MTNYKLFCLLDFIQKSKLNVSIRVFSNLLLFQSLKHQTNKSNKEAASSFFRLETPILCYKKQKNKSFAKNVPTCKTTFETGTIPNRFVTETDTTNLGCYRGCK